MQAWILGLSLFAAFAFAFLFRWLVMRDLRNAYDAIRRHRDARGHDRCWENDADLYRELPESHADLPPQLPPRREFLEQCGRYYDGQSLGIDSRELQEPPVRPPL